MIYRTTVQKVYRCTWRTRRGTKRVGALIADWGEVVKLQREKMCFAYTELEVTGWAL